MSRPEHLLRGFYGVSLARRSQPLLNHGFCPTTRTGNVTSSSTYSTRSSSLSKVVFSGIQPTGVPHLGNYLGALREWVRIQNDSDKDSTLIFSLVDLHAITIRQDPEHLRQWKKSSLATLLAIGLDPQRSILFHQSDVHSHTELMWILSCLASTGRLSRMTQWKDKTASGGGEKENGEKLKLGLFSYPVLQAADVLLYRATHVPVGHDQAQHLEFARDLADAFHHFFSADSTSQATYGNRILPAPTTLISPAKRIMSLTRPTTKMSKSEPDERSRIVLTDSRDVIHAKLRAAVTDSLPGIEYLPDVRPGVSNLIDILYHVTADGSGSRTEQGSTVIDVEAGKVALAKDRAGLSLRALKEEVADAIDQVLDPIREKYTALMSESKTDELHEIAADGARRAQTRADETMVAVKHAVGLL